MTVGVENSRAVMRHHSKSFSLAHKLLPAPCRDPAALVYAWCRRADDSVDECSPRQAGQALAELERELDEIYAGVRQSDPVLEGFRHVVSESAIPKQYPAELLAGMRMDVEGVVYHTGCELSLYCFRVAGTVGLMMCHVMGVTNSRALRHAAHLGIAMQLTNICRDVVEDWGRGRLYVPRELLGKSGQGLSVSGHLPGELTPVLARAVEALLEQADHFYASGDRGLDYLSPRSMWAVLVARLVYSRIGDVLRGRGCDITRGRAQVPLATKLWLLARGFLQVLARLPGHQTRFRSSRRSLPALRYPVDVLPP